jgi:hypothetical protein
MKNTGSVILIFFSLITANGYAQTNTPSVINSSGGSLQTGYYHFEWSVGELALVNQMASSDNNLIVTNGFLQPYVLNPGTNNLSSQFGKDEIRIFPNPAPDHVEINFFTRQKGKIRISFYDASGKKVYDREVTCYGVDLVETIKVNHLANGIYGLQIDLVPDDGYVSKHGLYKLIKVQ